MYACMKAFNKTTNACAKHLRMEGRVFMSVAVAVAMNPMTVAQTVAVALAGLWLWLRLCLRCGRKSAGHVEDC